MKREVQYNGDTIEYDLQYKNVKNINLRIKSDGSVHVSANKRVPLGFIESFIISKVPFILRAKEKYTNLRKMEPTRYFTEDELVDLINKLCTEAYPYFEKLGIPYPAVKFRKMRSRFGTCNSTRHVLTFSTILMFAPRECINYVVLHEFTHFLVPNHSKRFYLELSKICPDYARLRKQLKEIVIC